MTILPSFSCIHANECPVVCPCSVACYCRDHTCKPTVRDTNRERVTGSSASIQTVGTPRWLIDSVEKTFGEITLDVAADAVNKVCRDFIGESTDATSLPYWIAPYGGIVWCNPPYKNAGKFAEVALASAKRGQVTAMLVLASVGSKWWADYVHSKADVYFIRPRLKFIGHDTPFMKDLAILTYDGYTVNAVGSYFVTKLVSGDVQNILTASR